MKHYIHPECTVLSLRSEDVITASINFVEMSAADYGEKQDAIGFEDIGN